MLERKPPRDGRHGNATVVRLVDSVLEIWLNRPAALNATTDQMVHEINDALDRVEPDGVRAVVLAGVGRGFCAGRDLSGFDSATESAEALLEGLYNPLIVRLDSLNIPSIATVHGAVLGTGLGLALACDLVLAAQSTKIGSPFPRIGAVLDSGGHAFLVERVGWTRANDLILTGRLLEGDQAERIGLVSRVLADEDFERGCAEIISQVAAGPTAAFREQKQLLRRLRGYSLNELLTQEAAAQGRASHTHDYAEGIQAFLHKRSPTFEGK